MFVKGHSINNRPLSGSVSTDQQGSLFIIRHLRVKDLRVVFTSVWRYLATLSVLSATSYTLRLAVHARMCVLYICLHKWLFFFLHMTLLNSSKLLHNITWPRTRRMDSSEFYITLSCTPQKPNSIHPSIHFLPFFWLSPCTSSSSSKGTLSSQVMQSHHVSWICPTVYSCSKLLPFRRSLARMPSRCCLYLRFLLGFFFGCDTKLMAVVESRNADQLLMPQQSVRPPPPLSCH